MSSPMRWWENAIRSAVYVVTVALAFYGLRALYEDVDMATGVLALVVAAAFVAVIYVGSRVHDVRDAELREAYRQGEQDALRGKSSLSRLRDDARTE